MDSHDKIIQGALELRASLTDDALVVENLPAGAHDALRENDPEAFARALADSPVTDGLSLEDAALLSLALYLKYQSEELN